jgi:hypothetical protein
MSRAGPSQPSPNIGVLSWMTLRAQPLGAYGFRRHPRGTVAQSTGQISTHEVSLVSTGERSHSLSSAGTTVAVARQRTRPGAADQCRP